MTTEPKPSSAPPKRMTVLGALACSALAVGLTIGGLVTLGAIKTGAHTDPVNIAALQLLGFGLAIAFGLKAFSNVDPAIALRHHAVSALTLGLAFAGGFALQFPLAESVNLLSSALPMSLEEQLHMQRMVSPDSVFRGVALVCAVVVVAPVMEELLFRGLIQRGLTRTYGAGIAVAVSTVLFAASHMSPHGALAAFLGGLALAWLAYETDSVWVPIAAHMGINAAPVALPERVSPIHGFNVVSEEVLHIAPVLLLGSGMAAACFLFAASRLGAVSPDREP